MQYNKDLVSDHNNFKMIKILILTFLIINFTPFLLFCQETRIIKGVVTEGNNETLIGARVEEYGNIQNYALTNLNGVFELTIPKKNKVLLRFTYGCSVFYDVLYEIDKEEDYLNIDAYTKSVDRNTRRIRRKLKLKQL